MSCSNDIERVEASNLTVKEFVDRYEKPVLPVIITGNEDEN